MLPIAKISASCHNQFSLSFFAWKTGAEALAAAAEAAAEKPEKMDAAAAMKELQAAQQSTGKDVQSVLADAHQESAPKEAKVHAKPEPASHAPEEKHSDSGPKIETKSESKDSSLLSNAGHSAKEMTRQALPNILSAPFRYLGKGLQWLGQFLRGK